MSAVTNDSVTHSHSEDVKLHDEDHKSSVSPLPMSEKDDFADINKAAEIVDLTKISAREADRLLAVRNAAFTAAVSETKLNPLSRESFILYAMCGICFLCECANGYDGSLMTAINAMPYYKNYFDVSSVGSTAGLVFSIYNAGGIIAAFPGAWISDRYGRRGSMFAGACFILFGMAIISSAQNLHWFIGGRFILGWGVTIITIGAAAYIGEVAPPQWKGRMLGLYNCGYFGGAIPAAAITFGTSYIKSNISWRLPLIFQGVPSLLVACTIWFMHESPRWLIANGRPEEAHSFLTRFHGNGNPESPLVKLEWAEFQEQIALDGADKRWWDYRALFATKNHRWRFLMVMMISVFGQFSGNGLGYFNTVIYGNLGYTAVGTQLALNLGSTCVSALCAVTGALLSDKMPRVRVLTIGTFMMAVWLAINAGLSHVWAQQPADHPNLKVGQAAVAAYFLFGATFSFTLSPLQGAYPVENLETTTRAKGLALSGVLVSLIGFINTYAGPIGLKNIQNNYVWVFVGWDLIETALWFLVGVETQGRTLEELDEIYNAKYPPFASRRKAKLAVKNNQLALVTDA